MNTNIYSFQKIEMFKGAKFLSEELTSLKDIIEEVRSGVYLDNLNAYRKAKEEAKGEKVGKEGFIPSIAPHAIISDRILKLKFDDENNKPLPVDHSRWESTGIVHIDLDHIPLGDLVKVRTRILATNPMALFVSPSGDGMKVFFKHDMGTLDTYQKENFSTALKYAIRTYLERLDLGQYYDPAPTTINTQCYLTVDPNAVYNEESTPMPLSKAYSELMDTDAELAKLKNEMAKLAKTKIQDGKISDTAIQKQMMKHIGQSQSDGGGESFKFALWFISRGASDEQIIPHIEAFRVIRGGKWSSAKKVADARRWLLADGNTSEVNLDLGIDTERFKAIQRRIAELQAYRQVSKGSLKRGGVRLTKDALRLVTNIDMNLTTELVRPDSYYIEKAVELHRKLDSQIILSLVENAGAGKSRTIGLLAKQIEGDCGQGTFNGLAFATNTRSNRDAFIEKNPQFVAIYGIIEIIERVTTKEIADYAGTLFDTDDLDTTSDVVLKVLLEEGTITADQLVEIKKQRTENFTKLNNPFISLCYAKITKGGLVEKLHSKVIVLDEMDAKNVVGIQAGTKFLNCYINKDEEKRYFELTAKEQKREDEIRDFMFKIIHCRTGHYGHLGGIIMMSAEKSLSRAFGTRDNPNPYFRGDLNGFTVNHCGSPVTLYDENLTVVRVRSTSSAYKEGGSARARLVRAAKAQGYTVICDGHDAGDVDGDKIQMGERLGDYTFEGAKGSNELMKANTCVILSCPSPAEIVVMAHRLNCSWQSAAMTIMSDKANQAIGRNTGYRQRGGQCLLIIPERAVEWDVAGLVEVPDEYKHFVGYSADCHLMLDTISNNVFTVTSKADVGQLTGKARDMFVEFHGSSHNIIEELGERIFKMIPVDVKVAKSVIQAGIDDSSLTKEEKTNGGLMKQVIEYLSTKGVEKKSVERVVAGVRTKSQVYKMKK